MKRRARVLAMIMAGGKGERLHPLTRDRSKPAVPFAGRYRIVDFVLSNFVNSDMLSLYVLVQYKSQSLIEHVRLAWRTTGIVPDYFVTVVPPQMRFGPAWYRGTADAVLQNLNLIDDFGPDVVAIFGSDHVYRIDVNQMLAFHQEAGADVTIAARPVPLGDAVKFGVLGVDRAGLVQHFAEKPAQPAPMPGDPTRGKSIFFGKGECASCHTVSGEGGFLGPDLSSYGSTTSSQAIRNEILKSSRVNPLGCFGKN